MKKINRNKKLVVLAGVLLIALFVVPNLAGAQLGFLSPINLVTVGFRVIASIFNFVFGFIFMFAGWLIEIAMTMNRNILNDSNALVRIGWTISRDIANLGFVLIMIVMAVATIVRWERYSAKLLPVLIGAAILVNFSLTIAGVLINFSNIVSNTFSSKLESGQITDALAGAFNPQRLLLKPENPPPPDPADQGSALSDFSTAVLVSIAGLIFNVVFLAVAALSMFALALMLLYRYIYLSIILVLAPLAWMFWIFPDLKHLFGEWWKNFLKWTFFLPATTFFLFLAIRAAEELGNAKMFTGGSIFSTGNLAGIMEQGAQMVVLTGLLLGGLIAAQKMGIEGAKGTMSIAEKLGKGARKGLGEYARDKGKRTALRAGGTGIGQATLSGLSTGLHAVGLRGLASRIASAGAASASFKNPQTRPKAKSFFGSLAKGIAGQFGVKQWQCTLNDVNGNPCLHTVGPSKKPPNKCPNPSCASNQQNNPNAPKPSWKAL